MDVILVNFFTKTRTHFFVIAPSFDINKIDIRNNKEAVDVNVMKDKTYNVRESVEVVYDLQPNKLVDLLSNYPIIRARVLEQRL